MLGARPGDAGRVSFLKGVVADQMGRNLPGDADQRDRIHLRVEQAGHGVGRAGPRCHQHAADPTGRARIALGRMHRAAFLADQHMADLVLLEHRIVNRQYGAAGITEHGFHAIIRQRRENHLGATHLPLRHAAFP